MDLKEKLKKEIDRLNELIKDCENKLQEMQDYLRTSQELALSFCKKELAALEQEYMKLFESDLHK